MARVSFDAGVLIGLERRDTRAWAWLKRATERGEPPIVCAAVVAECWRDGRRQPVLASALRVCDIVSVDLGLACAAGEALARVRGADTVDALAAATAAHAGALLVTDDLNDLRSLADVHFRGLRLASLSASR